MNEMLAMPRALSEQTVELRIGIILTRKEVSFSAIPPRKGSNDAPSHIAGRDKILPPGGQNTIRRPYPIRMMRPELGRESHAPIMKVGQTVTIST